MSSFLRALVRVTVPVVFACAFALTPSAALATTADGSLAAQAAPCREAVTRGAYTGYKHCGSPTVTWTAPNGGQEMFVVGMDDAVWHIWQRWVGDTTWSGWHSMGGRVLPTSRAVYRASEHTPSEIWVVGTDQAPWFNYRHPDRGWLGWRHTCVYC